MTMTQNNQNNSAAVVANTLVASGPAYVALAQAISDELRSYGVEPKQHATVIDGIAGNANWACWEHPETGHKIYLSRSKNGVGVIHTTLRVPPTTPGYVDPKGKAPGLIESFFTARKDVVLAHLIPLFVDTRERLASRKQKAAAARTTAGETQTVTAEDVKTISVG